MENPDALIKHAVHDIVNEINSGMTPQAATIKVARQLELNNNFIKRAAEAVNVALHYNHFKKNANAKAEDFPIVDAQKVAEEVLTLNTKTAAQFKSELFSSLQHDEVAPKFARYLEDGPHKKAYEKILAEKAESAFPMSIKGVYEKSANYIRDLKKTAEDAQAVAMEADFQVTRTFGSILEKFAKASDYRTSFDEFESQVYSKYGEKANEWLDLIYKSAHVQDARGKHDSNYTMFNPCPELALFDNFLAKAAQLHTIKKEAEDAEYNYNFEKKYIQEAFVKRGCELFKVAAEPTGSILERLEADTVKQKEKLAELDETDPVLANIKLQKEAALNKETLKIKEAVDYIDQAMNSARAEAKPGLTATTNSEADNRDRAFLLQELATTDPILSKIPTQHVVNSYQQLMRIAPEISKEKDMVRSYLRQSTATQALDPYQGQQLIEANTKLLKIKNYSRLMAG